MDAFLSFSDTLLVRLAWTTVQASVLIGVLWLLGRALPRLPPATRCVLWWLLGVQLLVGLGWQAPVRLPLLPAAATASAPAAPAHTAPTMPWAAQVMPTTTVATAPVADTSASAPAAAATGLPWRQALVTLWLVGLLVQLAGMARHWRRTRSIRRQSRPLRDPRLHALCARQARQLGLRRCPDLRVSDALDSPQVTGLLRPVVLLPARHNLGYDEQAMALAHELTHLQRGDLWLGWIPTLARTLFFFNPLVHLAMREYALHREAACDGQALRLQHAEAQTYGQLLLRLGVERRSAACMAGASSPTYRHLKRRLIMLQHTAMTLPRFRDWLLVALVALAFITPYRLVGASPMAQAMAPAARVASAASIAPAPAPPFPTRSALPVGPPLPPAPPKPPTPPHAAIPPAPPLPPAPPMPPAPPNYGFHASTTNIDIEPDARFGLVLFDGRALTINGTSADANAIKRIPKSGHPVLWFRHDGTTWMTHDKAVIARAKQIYTPTIQLARQQGQLAEKLGMLEGQWATLDARGSDLEARQDALAQRKAALERQQAMLAQYDKQLAAQAAAAQDQKSAADSHALAARRQELASRESAMAARQQALVAQQERFQSERAAMKAESATQREALKQQQAALQRQQAALARRGQQTRQQVAQALQQLLGRAATEGKTERVPAH